MTRAARLTPFLALAALACGSSKARPPCTPPTGPACGIFFCAGDLESDWVTTQAATGFCTPTPPATVNELYASCQGVDGASTSSCAGVAVGQQYCNEGSLTMMCLQDSDCPGGTRCYADQVVSADHVTFGFCEKSCTTAGNADCGRCDLACDPNTMLCVYPGPGYPTNTPCDATHPAIDIMAAFDGTPLGQNGTLTLTLPGVSPIVVYTSTTPVILPYPPGATAGPASVSLFAEQGALATIGGETDFQADPTMCTVVTINLMIMGLSDAGP